MADALKYILEWAAAVCTAIPHLSVQFVQSLADAIAYSWEWAAGVCTAVPNLSVQFVKDFSTNVFGHFHLMFYPEVDTAKVLATAYKLSVQA